MKIMECLMDLCQVPYVAKLFKNGGAEAVRVFVQSEYCDCGEGHVNCCAGKGKGQVHHVGNGCAR